MAADGAGWHVQGCRACAGVCFPPRLRCPHCGSADLAWAPTGTAGTVVGVVRVSGDNDNFRHRAPRHLRGPQGYATGIVELEHWPGVRFPVLLVGEDAVAGVVGGSVVIGTARVGERLVPVARCAPLGVGSS
ncbi:Zn-ribbon domain-containing OB-fold protein [Pseudofrankia asymbiotica]|uniref:Zn-ribbon domain-containing OB-fold protein n=1 Tax=Pseudofrankia asymbiotica TaxID=1834516 RepID=UPI003B75B60B